MLKTTMVSLAILFALIASAPLIVAQETDGQIELPGARGTYIQIDFPGADKTYANGINTAGDVVGTYYDGYLHGFVLRAGVYTKLDPPGATWSSASGINDKGQIVGFGGTGAFVYDVQTQAFTTFEYSQNTHTYPSAINNSGTIVGTIYNFTFKKSMGFELNGTTYTIIEAPGVPPNTFLFSINNLGQAVVMGRSNFGGVSKNFLLKDGKLKRLRNPADLQPAGINDTNAMVGYYVIQFTDDFAGFVKPKGKGFSRLMFAGSVSTVANGINNAGVVVGSYSYYSDDSHGFMWTPPADAKK